MKDSNEIIVGALAIFGAILIVIAISFLLAWPVMALWNGCLVDAIDVVHEITWLQAWGIGALCSILFKSQITTTKKDDK
jgi:hypothetical protein